MPGSGCLKCPSRMADLPLWQHSDPPQVFHSCLRTSLLNIRAPQYSHEYVGSPWLKCGTS